MHPITTFLMLEDEILFRPLPKRIPSLSLVLNFCIILLRGHGYIRHLCSCIWNGIFFTAATISVGPGRATLPVALFYQNKYVVWVSNGQFDIRIPFLSFWMIGKEKSP